MNYVKTFLVYIMIVDNVLILAAGKGTRMGEIGKVLPKVIWPIFNKSILELEVEYAKTFNPKKIFINVYNYKEKVIKHIESKKTFRDVEILEEKEELDIGGAIHNLARRIDYKGNLLILNSDQFIILSEKKKIEFYNSYLSNDVTLLVYNVDPNDGYSGLNIVDGKVRSIINKESACKKIELITYTGMSLVNLEKITPTQGKSSFFSSVANLDKYKVGAVHIKDSQYWDFGTKKRFIHSIKHLKSKSGEFQDFLKNTGVQLDESKSEIIVVQNNIVYRD